jgi:hypothetical protein
MTGRTKGLALLALLLGGTATWAQQPERIELESRVSGNQEQPKVLYVLPWQPPTPPEAGDAPLGSALDAALEAPERDELLLELELFHKSRAPAAENPR